MSDLAFLSTYYPFIPPTNASSDTLRVLGCIRDINIIAVLASGDAPELQTSKELWHATLDHVTFSDGLVTGVHVVLNASGAYDFLAEGNTRVETCTMSLGVAYINSDSYPVGNYAICSDDPYIMQMESFTWRPDLGQVIRVHPDTIMFVQQAPRISLWGLDRPGNPIRRADSTYAYSRGTRCEIDPSGVSISGPYMLGKDMSFNFEDGYNVSMRPSGTGVIMNAETDAGIGQYAFGSGAESLPYDTLHSVGKNKPSGHKTRRNRGLVSINGISGRVVLKELGTSAQASVLGNAMTIKVPAKEDTNI